MPSTIEGSRYASYLSRRRSHIDNVGHAFSALHIWHLNVDWFARLPEDRFSCRRFRQLHCSRTVFARRSSSSSDCRNIDPLEILIVVHGDGVQTSQSKKEKGKKERKRSKKQLKRFEISTIGAMEAAQRTKEHLTALVHDGDIRNDNVTLTLKLSK